MRYATLLLTWGNAKLHPLSTGFANNPDVHIETLHYINSVDESGYTELTQVRGDLTQARKLLQRIPEVINFEMSKNGIIYVHYKSSRLMDSLLAVLFDNEIVLKWPVQFVRTNGKQGAQITFLGTSHALTNAIDAIPSEIETSLRRTGEFQEIDFLPTSVLTERQRDILDVAVRTGYYEIPRQTTHQEIAAELALAPATVSEHLQRVESNLISSLFPT